MWGFTGIFDQQNTGGFFLVIFILKHVKLFGILVEFMQQVDILKIFDFR
jgi:hypothetical protein